jgi:hypothetical protein
MTVNFYRNSPEIAIEILSPFNSAYERTRRRKSTGPTAPALCGSARSHGSVQPSSEYC